MLNTYLAVVDTDNTADHLGDDNHVTEVGLDDRGLFVGRRLFLSLTELLDETQRLALETALEPTTSTSVDELIGVQCKGLSVRFRELVGYILRRTVGAVNQNQCGTSSTS